MTASIARLETELETALKSEESYRAQLEEARSQALASEQQLDSATRLLRQQTLTALRLERQLTEELQRAESTKQLFEQNRQSVIEAEAARLRAERSCGEAERIQRVLTAELQGARETSTRYELLSKDLASLIIPVWMRRLIPRGIRPVGRALKRKLS